MNRPMFDDPSSGMNNRKNQDFGQAPGRQGRPDQPNRRDMPDQPGRQERPDQPNRRDMPNQPVPRVMPGRPVQPVPRVMPGRPVGMNRDFYRNHCGNCQEQLAEGDEFCRYCGTRRGEGAFGPYRNSSSTIYGPPPRVRHHHCLRCGFQWKTNRMVDNQKYCPHCGGPAPVDPEERY